VTQDGVKGAWSTQPSLSADGSRVAFSSGSRLHPADDDNETDAYVKDLRTGEVILASASGTGEKGNARSSLASISADGNRVAFLSGATNLHPSGSSGLMVKDLTSGWGFESLRAHDLRNEVFGLDAQRSRGGGVRPPRWQPPVTSTRSPGPRPSGTASGPSRTRSTLPSGKVSPMSRA
jgi:hypothetical protein